MNRYMLRDKIPSYIDRHYIGIKRGYEKYLTVARAGTIKIGFFSGMSLSNL